MPHRFSRRIKWNNVCKPPVKWKRVNTFQFLPSSAPQEIFLSDSSSLHESQQRASILVEQICFLTSGYHILCPPPSPPSHPQILYTLFSVNLVWYIWSQVFFSGETSVVWIPWNPLVPIFIAITISIGIWLYITLQCFQSTLYLHVLCIPDYFARKCSALL